MQYLFLYSASSNLRCQSSFKETRFDLNAKRKVAANSDHDECLHFDNTPAASGRSAARFALGGGANIVISLQKLLLQMINYCKLNCLNDMQLLGRSCHHESQWLPACWSWKGSSGCRTRTDCEKRGVSNARNRYWYHRRGTRERSIRRRIQIGDKPSRDAPAVNRSSPDFREARQIVKVVESVAVSARSASWQQLSDEPASLPNLAWRRKNEEALSS